MVDARFDVTSPDAEVSLPPATARVAVTRWTGHGPAEGEDQVAEEVPVALVYNGISHAVMLASPRDLEDLALGFSLSEGILAHPGELYGLEVVTGCDGVALHLEIASRRFVALKERRRNLAGRTGCGLCGVESLEAVRRPVQAAGGPGLPSPEAVARALADLAAWQPLHQETGAVHGAAWVLPEGQIRLAREDVGRHNALDKLLGALARDSRAERQTAVSGEEAPWRCQTPGFVLVTSRASYEMVQKSATLGIACLAAISAPTAMAVRLAQEAGMALLGFVRPGRMVVYAQGGAPAPQTLQERS